MGGGVCLVCGQPAERLDQHAPGLEENYPDATVGVCPACHNGPGGLTERAFEVGMLHDHNVKERPRTRRPYPERAWCLVQGTADLVGQMASGWARALNAPRFEEPARGFHRFGLAFSRIFWLLEPGEGLAVPVPLGPEPAKNLRRAARRSHRARERTTQASLRQLVALFGYLVKLSRAAEAELRAAPPSTTRDLLIASQQRDTEMLLLVARHSVTILRGLYRMYLSDAGPVLDEVVQHLERRIREGMSAIAASPDEDAVGWAMVAMARIMGPVSRHFDSALRALADDVPPETVAWRLVAAITEEVAP